METIHSIKDPKVVLAREVGTRKGRVEHGRFLLEGEQMMDWALERGAGVEFILAGTDSADHFRKRYAQAGVPVYAVTDGVRRKISSSRHTFPVYGVGKIEQSHARQDQEMILVLDRLQDFGNIGTILRSCAAFNIQLVVAADSGFDPFQRQTVHASRGTVFGMQFQCFDSPHAAVEYLRRSGYWIVATSPRGTQLQSLVDLPAGPVALVVGNETDGISPVMEQEADLLVQIPLSEQVESLNVGVAAGISIYEIRIRQVLGMIERRIKSTLGRELNVAGMLVQRALDQALRSVSAYSSTQVVFMMVLRCDGVMSMDHLCRQFGLLEKDVDHFLTPLIEAGFIARDSDLRLTAHGEESLAKLWPVVEKTEASLLEDLTEEERTQFLLVLKKIQDKAAGLSGECSAPGAGGAS